MATLKQIRANCKNAKKSTGPLSAEGKAVSSRNALKSGIDANTETALPFEIPENLTALRQEYYDRYAPTTPEQRCLVDDLISDEWMLRRFRAIEGQMLTRQYEQYDNKDGELFALQQSYIGCMEILNRLQRRVNATRRSYLASLAALEKLRAQPAVEPEIEPEIELASQPVATELLCAAETQATEGTYPQIRSQHPGQDLSQQPDSSAARPVVIGFVPSISAARPDPLQCNASHDSACRL